LFILIGGLFISFIIYIFIYLLYSFTGLPPNHKGGKRRLCRYDSHQDDAGENPWEGRYKGEKIKMRVSRGGKPLPPPLNPPPSSLFGPTSLLPSFQENLAKFRYPEDGVAVRWGGGCVPVGLQINHCGFSSIGYLKAGRDGW